MRTRAIAALALVTAAAGCGDDRVVIDVEVGALGADRVELYLGSEPCAGAACDGIGSPLARAPRANSEVWFADTAAPLELAVRDGHARIELAPGGRDGVPLAIAVGLAGDQVVGWARLAIALDAPRRYELPLAAPASAAAVERWGDAARCVIAREPGDGRAYAVVPGADPDCDAAAPECTGGEAVYLAELPPTGLDDLRCLARFPDLPGAAVCQAGGGCRDGDPDACLASPYCVPGEACTSGCAWNDTACIGARLMPSPERATCVIALEESGAACATPVVYTLQLPAFAAANRTCKDARFVAFPAAGSGPSPPWQDLAAADLRLASGLRLTTPRLDAPCKLSLEVADGATLPATTEPAAVIVGADNGHQLVVPLEIVHDRAPGACAAAVTTCTVPAGVDAMWRCVAR